MLKLIVVNLCCTVLYSQIQRQARIFTRIHYVQQYCTVCHSHSQCAPLPSTICRSNKAALSLLLLLLHFTLLIPLILRVTQNYTVLNSLHLNQTFKQSTVLYSTVCTVLLTILYCRGSGLLVATSPQPFDQRPTIIV